MPAPSAKAKDLKHKSSPEDNLSTASTPPPEPFWKQGGFQSAEEANTAFWDNLSKVPLCPRALKEFDRRNSLFARSGLNSPRAAIRPIIRSTTRSAALVSLSNIQNGTAEECTNELKRFARRGGPGLRNLRGYSESVSAFPSGQGMPPKKNLYSSPPASNGSRKKTRRTSAYDPGFEQKLVDHGIYPPGHRLPDGNRLPKPNNWEEIQQRLAQRRPSLSPSEFSDGAFDTFVDQNTQSLNETEVTTNVFPIIQGHSIIPSAMKRTFGNLAPLTDGSIVNAQPDVYCGATPQQLDARVRQDLGSYVVPSTNLSVPILPNHFTERKGPKSTISVAKRQAMHNGAVGARAMHHLQSYGQLELVYDNSSYTITSSYSDGLLQIYTTHPTAPVNPGGRPEYYMNKLNGWDMTGNPEAFRQGATAYRNARDWAKEKRDEMIEIVNQKATSVARDMSFD